MLRNWLTARFKYPRCTDFRQVRALAFEQLLEPKLRGELNHLTRLLEAVVLVHVGSRSYRVTLHLNRSLGNPVIILLQKGTHVLERVAIGVFGIHLSHCLAFCGDVTSWMRIACIARGRIRCAFIMGIWPAYRMLALARYSH